MHMLRVSLHHGSKKNGWVGQIKQTSNFPEGGVTVWDAFQRDLDILNMSVQI